MSINTILILLAALSFFLATVGYPPMRVNLTALGLFLYMLALLVGV